MTTAEIGVAVIEAALVADGVASLIDRLGRRLLDGGL
jgi:hypothetical protein